MEWTRKKLFILTSSKQNKFKSRGKIDKQKKVKWIAELNITLHNLQYDFYTKLSKKSEGIVMICSHSIEQKSET